MKYNIRQRILFAFDKHDSDFMVGLQSIICFVKGHEPVRDNCGLPEHDFCGWCNKTIPDSWKSQ